MSPEEPLPSSSREPAAPPLSGKKVLYLFLGFFGFILIVNGLFIVAASLSNPGTVTDEAYEKGLAYNKVVDEAAAQQNLRWSHKLTVRMDVDKKQRVALRMKHNGYQLLTGGSAIIRFYHPVGKGIDFDVELKETRPGSYLALAEFPAKGLWDAYIAVRKGKDVYRARERLLIQ